MGSNRYYLPRSRSMTGARAERNEFLLLHEFHRHKYICPDKTFPKNNKAVVVEQGDMDQDEGKITNHCFIGSGDLKMDHFISCSQ